VQRLKWVTIMPQRYCTKSDFTCLQSQQQLQLVQSRSVFTNKLRTKNIDISATDHIEISRELTVLQNETQNMIWVNITLFVCQMTKNFIHEKPALTAWFQSSSCVLLLCHSSTSCHNTLSVTRAPRFPKSLEYWQHSNTNTDVQKQQKVKRRRNNFRQSATVYRPTSRLWRIR